MGMKLAGSFRTFLSVTAAALAIGAAAKPTVSQPHLSTRDVPLLLLDGYRFRDLDRNGKLSPFEDWRLTPEERATDLVSRMTLEDKAGTMMHSSLAGIGSPIGRSAKGYELAAVRHEILDLNITSFITRLAVSPRVMAEQNNAVQEVAEHGRFGIPITISSDPRHHFQHVDGASNISAGYSQWPEPLGFAALRDPAIVRHFADIARQEYRATGIRQALSPQADLFSEPRWARGTGTFGSDPDLVGHMVGAYIEGFQGGAAGLSRDGVLAVVKHWVGYGATPNGWDGHNYYGRFVQVGDRSLSLHIRPFEAAFRANVGGLMPTYSIVRGATVDGRKLEEVGGGFNRQLLTDLLRAKYGYRGIVLSDWNIASDCTEACRDPNSPQPASAIGMPWGVEHLSSLERYAKGINAGIDQFGGGNEPNQVVEAVRRGLVPVKRVDDSVRRILISKFRMGLFEDPFVDPARAATFVGNASFQAQGLRAQAQSQILLKNRGAVLPVRGGTKVWLRGVDPGQARRFGLVVVDRPEEADFALVRISTPFETLHPNHFFGARQNEGRLDFRPGNADFDAVHAVAGKTRVVLSLFSDRPAILTRIAPMADAILVNFGASDEALLRVVTGRQRAEGRLPFEFPSSMQAVEAQDPAMPDDSINPLYRFGAGIELPDRRR
jgi:beta-glucosidase